MGISKNRWKISFIRSTSSSSSTPKSSPKRTPVEFLCPISASLMAEPVIVSSGQTFERNCIEACKELGFLPRLSDGSKPDFSALIPNIAIKSTILHWCDDSGVERPKPLEADAARDLIRSLMAAAAAENIETKEKGEIEIETKDKELLKGVSDNPPVKFSHAATEVNHRPNHFHTSSSESLATMPLPLATKPSCYSSASSSSSSEITTDEAAATTCHSSSEEEQLISKMRSSQISDQEEAVISLRKTLRDSEEQRVSLCSSKLISALRPLIVSKYSTIQINAVASLVNISLEKKNKVKIMRSGSVPALIEVLKGGFGEAQEHAAGAVFSLALADENKTAIGVLGALQPLMHLLTRSDRVRARQDAALALYHLSLVQSNRSKLVKLGSVQTLLGMAKEGGDLLSRILLILCNLASCTEGRAAMLDANAVEGLVEIMRRERGSEENCVGVMYALSLSNLRFKGLMKSAGGAGEALKDVAEKGSERAKEKAKRMLVLMREEGEASGGGGGGGGGEEAADEAERVSDSLVTFRQRYQYRGKNVSGANSTEF